MAESTAAKPVYMFYHIQGERGESAAHPNACKLTTASPGKVTLADVLSSFPLTGSSSFHFRFQVAVDKQIMFLDLSNPDDNVPLMNGSVIAKVLRLDTAKSASRITENLGIRLKQQSSAPRAASSAARGPPGGEPAASPTSGSAGRAAPKPAGSGGAPSGTGASAPTAAASSGARATGIAAVIAASTSSTNDEPVVVPDEVDADLEGKSDYVKAKVMERRAELKRAQEARLAEVAQRDAAAAGEQDERERFKAQHDATLSAWSCEPSGSKRNIRALLSTMHSVLWEGAKWEPVPMAKLVMAPKVKFFFMRACTIVHPDKHNTMDASQRYVATNIFHTLESAYRHFQETEMNNA